MKKIISAIVVIGCILLGTNPILAFDSEENYLIDRITINPIDSTYFDLDSSLTVKMDYSIKGQELDDDIEIDLPKELDTTQMQIPLKTLKGGIVGYVTINNHKAYVNIENQEYLENHRNIHGSFTFPAILSSSNGAKKGDNKLLFSEENHKMEKNIMVNNTNSTIAIKGRVDSKSVNTWKVKFDNTNDLTINKELDISLSDNQQINYQSIEVVDKTSNQLIDNYKVLNKGNNHFTLSFPSMNEGRYLVRFRSEQVSLTSNILKARATLKDDRNAVFDECLISKETGLGDISGTVISGDVDSNDEFGTLIIHKAINNKNIKGAKYKLFDEDFNIIQDNLVTNEKGKVTCKYLEEGIYYLKETYVPNGYNLYQGMIEVEIEEGEVTRIEIPYPQSGSSSSNTVKIILNITDEFGRPLKYTNCKLINFKTNRVIKDKLITNEKGEIIVSNLMRGEYALVISNQKHLFKIEGNKSVQSFSFKVAIDESTDKIEADIKDFNDHKSLETIDSFTLKPSKVNNKKIPYRSANRQIRKALSKSVANQKISLIDDKVQNVLVKSNGEMSKSKIKKSHSTNKNRTKSKKLENKRKLLNTKDIKLEKIQRVVGKQNTSNQDNNHDLIEKLKHILNYENVQTTSLACFLGMVTLAILTKKD